MGGKELKRTTHKICSGCRMAVPTTEFGKNRSKKDGLASHCRRCRKGQTKKYREKNRGEINKRNLGYAERNRDSRRQQGKKYYRSERGQEMSRRNQLRVKYGLTLEQHKQMYADQDGRCKICGELISYGKMQTDHDHDTGKVRGLLCRYCNLRLAVVEDAEFCEEAIKYLKEN